MYLFSRLRKLLGITKKKECADRTGPAQLGSNNHRLMSFPILMQC